MSITCGFYNAINHDRRYDAKQMSEIFTGIINDGVFMNIGAALAVKSSPQDFSSDYEAGQPMTVYVGSGRAWFNDSWTKNDSIEPINIPQAEVVLNRIDAVVLEVNSNDSVRNNTIKVVKGTPSTNPIKPILEDSEYVHQHALAYITVNADVTEITQAEIENCIGTSETPFVDGILKTIDADILIAQWDAQIGQWMKNIREALNNEDVLKKAKSLLYTDIPATLNSGSTTVTIKNDLILAETKITVFTDEYSISLLDASQTTGGIVLTFEKPTKDVNLIVRLEN